MEQVKLVRKPCPFCADLKMTEKLAIRDEILKELVEWIESSNITEIIEIWLRAKKIVQDPRSQKTDKYKFEEEK